jgi:cellobiose phosphorylase
MLGLRLDRGQLRFVPCTPATWSSFEVAYRYGATTVFNIRFRRLPAQRSALCVLLDGKEQSEPVIDLIDDGAAHRVDVEMP